MCTHQFERLFKSTHGPRDKFLSRIFGIIAEEPVRIWSRSPNAAYEDLGRPTLIPLGGEKGATLDFTLRSRADKRIFVSELKCELQYQDYRYLCLTCCSQVERHEKEKLAFRYFTSAARSQEGFTVRVNSKRLDMFHGAILVWGSVTEEGRRQVMERYGFADVLSLEQIISDLIRWGDDEYLRFVNERSAWCEELFRSLSERG